MNHSIENGFTLLELLISLAIMGLVSLMVFSGLRTATHAWEFSKNTMEKQQKLRYLYSKLIEEIKSAFPYQIKEERKYRLAFIGESDYLEFLSASDPMISVVTPGGLKRIAIHLDEDPVTPTEGLVIEESTFNYDEDFFEDSLTTSEEESNTILYEIDPAATGISFKYFYYPKLKVMDMEGNIEGKWVEKWGGDYEELIVEGEAPSEEEQQMINFMRYANLNLPVGIEIQITRIDEHGDQMRLPAFYISFSNAASISLNRL